MSDRLRIEPGLVLGERFEIRQHLDSGGFGDVYTAVNTGLGTEVAIKVKGKGTASRFWKEARMAARLESPYTVRIFDVGWQGDLLYIVMERLRGQSLQEFLSRHGVLDEKRALTWCRQLCSALSEAHSLHLVHRDIKPSNIFVCETAGGEQHIKLLDFGLAKELVVGDDLDTTESGVLLGTPSYMSPEQVRGDTLTVHSDLWSVGVVLFEMLTRKKPFDSPTRAATLVSIVTDPAPRLSSVSRLVSEETERLVARCLRKLPSERYDSAEELRRHLDQLLSDASSTPPVVHDAASDSTQQSVSFTAPPPSSPPTGVVRPRTKTRRVALALASALLIATLIAIVASRSQITSPTAQEPTTARSSVPAPESIPPSTAAEIIPSVQPNDTQQAPSQPSKISQPPPRSSETPQLPRQPSGHRSSEASLPRPQRNEPRADVTAGIPAPRSTPSSDVPLEPVPDQPPLILEPDF